MDVVDAQIHIWSPNSPTRRWPAGRRAYAHGPSLSAEYALRVMDRAGVVGRALTGLIQAPNSNGVTSRPATQRPEGGFRELAKQTIAFV